MHSLRRQAVFGVCFLHAEPQRNKGVSRQQTHFKIQKVQIETQEKELLP